MSQKKYYNLSVEDRQNLFRLKSAKIERKIEKEIKLRQEEIQWKAMKRNQKI